VESLISRPVGTSHAGLSPEERERTGIREGLLRLSVGLEAPEDIMEDLGQALKAASDEVALRPTYPHGDLPAGETGATGA
jgi:hypothetical protein